MFERYMKVKAKKGVNGVIFYGTPNFLLTLVSVNCTKVPKTIESEICAPLWKN